MGGSCWGSPAMTTHSAPLTCTGWPALDRVAGAAKVWWIYEVPEPACSHTDQLPIHMDADVVCLHAICVWLSPWALDQGTLYAVTGPITRGMSVEGSVACEASSRMTILKRVEPRRWSPAPDSVTHTT